MQKQQPSEAPRSMRRKPLLHYRDKTKYHNEVLETKAVFERLGTSRKATVVNLGCGNFVGMESFYQHFDHPLSTLFGIDKTRYKLIDFWLTCPYFLFYEANLFHPNTKVKDMLSDATHWIACCGPSKKKIIRQVGYQHWQEICQQDKAKLLPSQLKCSRTMLLPSFLPYLRNHPM